MTDSPYGVTPGGPWPAPGPPVGPPPPWPPTAPRQSRAPVIISLIVALFAIAVAIGAWFRPANNEPSPPAADSTPKYSDQQIVAGKKAVCAAYDLVNRASTYSGGQKSDDSTLTFVIAVNVRLTGTLAASYLLAELDKNPATPSDLTDAARELAQAYQQTTLLQLANAPKDELDSAYDTINSTDAKVVEACK
jgi:hypothetical protein